MADAAGLGVCLGWIMLVWLRQWRPERSWIDRSGRLLGLLWISAWSADLLSDVADLGM
jgi:hypothetical protein